MAYRQSGLLLNIVFASSTKVPIKKISFPTQARHSSLQNRRKSEPSRCGFAAFSQICFKGVIQTAIVTATYYLSFAVTYLQTI
jgi:hypothetical protein